MYRTGYSEQNAQNRKHKVEYRIECTVTSVQNSVHKDWTKQREQNKVHKAIVEDRGVCTEHIVQKSHITDCTEQSVHKIVHIT